MTKQDWEEFISSLYFVKWESQEELEEFVSEYITTLLQEQREELIEEVEELIGNGFEQKTNGQVVAYQKAIDDTINLIKNK